MEYCFEITKDSEAYNCYFEYLNAKKESIDTLMNFIKSRNLPLPISECGISEDTLWVKDTKENRIKFTPYLKTNSENGMLAFKKNSSIAKAWKALNVKIIHKPCVAYNFLKGCIGKSRERLFNVDDKVYCSVEPQWDMEVETPKGFIEMKQSEFYKMIEIYKEKRITA